MSDKEEKFPLNFDDKTWSVAEAVPWIFFGDGSAEQSWSEVTKLAVGYVVGEVDDGRLSRRQSAALSGLQTCLRNLGVLQRDTAIAPLLWCRIAIQFWLEHGGRQRKFVSAMTRWVKAKNRNGIAMVSYTNARNPNGREVPLEVFMFGTIDDAELFKTEWKYSAQSTPLSNQAKVKTKAKSTEKRSAESQVGSNLLAAVRLAVQELKNNRQSRKMFLRTADPDMGKFRFIGSREDLYAEILAISPDIRRKRQLKNGMTKKAYAESSVIKAISRVAICRLSWAKASRR